MSPGQSKANFHFQIRGVPADKVQNRVFLEEVMESIMEHYDMEREVAKTSEEARSENYIGPGVKRKSLKGSRFPVISALLCFSEVTIDEKAEFIHTICIRNAYSIEPHVVENWFLRHYENCQVSDIQVKDWVPLLRKVTSGCLFPAVRCNLAVEDLNHMYQARHFANIGKLPPDSFWQKYKDKAVHDHYLTVLNELKTKRPCKLQAVLPDLEFGKQEDGAPEDYRVPSTELWNKWVFYLRDVTTPGALKVFQPNKLPHIFIFGPSRVGKTWFVKNVLFRGLTDSEIFRPNTNSTSATFEHFDPLRHQVGWVDECPTFTPASWDLNKLKEVLGGGETLINVKHKAGRSVCFQIPFVFVNNDVSFSNMIIIIL
jgi:hypothetical protein